MTVFQYKRRKLFSLLVLIIASPAIAGPADAPESELAAVIADYERLMVQHPMVTGRSDLPDASLQWPDVTPAAMQRRRAGLEDLRKRLTALEDASLDEEDATNRDYLARILDLRIEGLAFDEQRFAFVAHTGFYNLPGHAARRTVIRNAADAEKWFERLRQIPAWFDAQVANLERGIATGWVQPNSVIDVAVAVVSAQLAERPADSPLLLPFDRLPDDMSAAAQEALRREAATIVAEVVRPAQQALLTYLEDEYRPNARPNIGIDSIPAGREYYDFLLRYYTTLDLSAEQIHALGLQEVERIRREMDQVIAASGFTGTFEEWLEYLREDPRFYVDTREELISAASTIAKRIDAELPKWFSTLPRLPFTVRPVPRDVEENYTTARYSGGDQERGLAGTFLVNTSHLDQRPLYELPALALHEAAPGHHTHSALTQENPDLPSFRRERDLLVYREGWALYAERLGEEMGIYRNAYERFGRLSAEMWRACRLVVDTGIHVMGWSYAQARACFTENSALSDINIDTELARYIGAPAGAVAYKLGELKIIELRERASQALADRFDIRRFHDLILMQGQLPMDILERRVEDWVAAQQQAPAER